MKNIYVLFWKVVKLTCFSYIPLTVTHKGVRKNINEGRLIIDKKGLRDGNTIILGEFSTPVTSKASLSRKKSLRQKKDPK